MSGGSLRGIEARRTEAKLALSHSVILVDTAAAANHYPRFVVLGNAGIFDNTLLGTTILPSGNMLDGLRNVNRAMPRMRTERC